jgi:hypothetical protein
LAALHRHGSHTKRMRRLIGENARRGVKGRALR